MLSLALGIGGATAVYAAFYAILVKPLPYGNAPRLVEIAEVHPQRGPMALRAAEYEDWRRAVPAFERVSAFIPESLSINDGTRDLNVVAEAVLPDFFDVLGSRVARGRALVSADYQSGGTTAIVLSDRLWRSAFGAAPSVLGRSVHVNDSLATVVGVMPPGFWRPYDVDVWMPLTLGAEEWRDRRVHRFIGLGALRPGVPLAQARAQLAAVYRQLAQTHVDDRGWSPQLTPYRGAVSVVGTSAPQLKVLFGGVILVLLIACANVATLAVARVVNRGPELAIRRALGANTAQILWLLTAEAALLGIVGGVLGLVLAASFVRWLTILTTRVFPEVSFVPQIDRQALLFAGMAVMFAIASGVLPLLRRCGFTTPLAAGRGTADRRTTRLRSVLIVLEIAGAVALVSATGLMFNTLMGLVHARLGFDAERVLTIALRLPESRYRTPRDWLAFEQDATRELDRLPGVVSAGVADHMPGTPFPGNVSYTTEGKSLSLDALSARFVRVSSGFVQALGLRMLAGRRFTDADSAAASGVAIVNDVLAHRVWPHESALGRILHVKSALNKDFRIVGVVTDTGMGPLQDGAEPIIYFPTAQLPSPDVVFFVRTALPPTALWGAANQAVSRLDSQIAGTKLRALSTVLADSILLPRASTALLMMFGVFAMFLAGGGVYGLLAFVVSQRKREIGIRMALGADSRSVRRLVVGQTYRLGGVGLLLGGLATVPMNHVLRSVFAQTVSAGASVVAATIVVVIGVIGVASILPVRRAMRIDPATTLRAE